MYEYLDDAYLAKKYFNSSRQAGARYKNIQIEEFSKSFKGSTYASLAHKIVDNLSFYLAKTAFPWERYTPASSTDKKTPIKEQLHEMVTPSIVSIMTNPSDSMQPKSRIHSTFVTINDKYVKLWRDDKFVKKMIKSEIKLLKQFMDFLGVVAQFCPDSPIEEYVMLLSELQEKLPTKLEQYTEIRKQMKEKKLIFVDGFIMEGKTEYTKQLAKDNDAYVGPERSDVWRHRFQFDDIKDQPSKFCMLFSPSICAVFSYFTFIDSMLAFAKSDKKVMIVDRSCFSVSIFNGMPFAIPAWFSILANFGIERFELNFIHRSNFKNFIFPLIDKRSAEIELYENETRLDACARDYYFIFAKLLKAVNLQALYQEDEFGVLVTDMWDDINFNDFFKYLI